MFSSMLYPVFIGGFIYKATHFLSLEMHEGGTA